MSPFIWTIPKADGKFRTSAWRRASKTFTPSCWGGIGSGLKKLMATLNLINFRWPHLGRLREVFACVCSYTVDWLLPKEQLSWRQKEKTSNKLCLWRHGRRSWCLFFYTVDADKYPVACLPYLCISIYCVRNFFCWLCCVLFSTHVRMKATLIKYLFLPTKAEINAAIHVYMLGAR